jgi:hypothetical protein
MKLRVPQRFLLVMVGGVFIPGLAARFGLLEPLGGYRPLALLAHIVIFSLLSYWVTRCRFCKKSVWGRRGERSPMGRNTCVNCGNPY